MRTSFLRQVRDPPWLVLHICFWVGLILVMLVTTHVITSGDHFATGTPVPLRSNPWLLTIGLSGIPLFIIFLWLANIRWPNQNRMTFLIGLLGLALCGGVLLGAMKPGSGLTVSRDLIYVPPSPPEGRVFAIPVFFPNGQYRLPQSELSRIRDVATVFGDCARGTLLIRGFASSLPYKTENEYKNRMLAIDRAFAVRAALDPSVGKSARIVEWKAFEDMAGARRLRDIGDDGQRVLEYERLNRRVELFWNDSPCMQALTADGSIEVVNAPAKATH